MIVWTDELRNMKLKKFEGEKQCHANWNESVTLKSKNVIPILPVRYIIDFDGQTSILHMLVNRSLEVWMGKNLKYEYYLNHASADRKI